MKTNRYLALTILGFASILASSALADNPPVVPEPARPSDSLVDSIGVCTHWGYGNSVYNTHWDKMQGLIGDLGVRTMRDGLGPRLDYLWNTYGMKTILVTGPVMAWDKYLETWKTNKDLIAGIEGPNEVNTAWKNAQGYEGDWWDAAPRFQRDLYKTVKSEPALKDIPVIALSTAYKGVGNALASLHGSLDYANAHSYASGGIPSQSLDFRDSYLLLGRGATLPPMVATECGYHTCLGSTKVKVGGQGGVSHATHRKYIPRQVAEYFNAGFHWAVIYEFGAGRAKPEQEDPEAAFGLVAPDATPKPAYYALKDLIAGLSESKWDSNTHQWKSPTPFPARALSFALQGAPPSLHHTVLQRSDGSFQLLLWNEVPSFDLKSKSDINNPEVPVHLVLKNKAASITVSQLGPDAPAPKQFQSVNEIDVKVPDEVIVLTIKPAAPLQPAPISPPGKIDAKTTPTSIDLSWPFAPGVDAYWITVNNRNMGMAQRGADGKAHFRATRLIPATTYPFEIVAASLDGGVSNPAKVPTATVDAFPDLVVKSFKVVPESPKAGEKVSFVAVVENIGKAPTDDGAPIGFRIFVDGKTVTRNDWVPGLAPGQQAEVKPPGAGAGMTWVVTPGNHNITASVDDYNRLIESNENNNKLTIPLGAK